MISHRSKQPFKNVYLIWANRKGSEDFHQFVGVFCQLVALLLFLLTIVEKSIYLLFEKKNPIVVLS